MKRIDLDQAGDAEAFGPLAVSRQRKHRKSSAPALPLTQAQAQVLSELADSFVRIAKEVGANHKMVKFGGVSLDLHEDGTEEVLSIRKAAH